MESQGIYEFGGISLLGALHSLKIKIETSKYRK